MSSTQVNAFIDSETQVEAIRSGTGTVYINIDSLTLFLATPEHTKSGALAVLARLTAAVEALPDDTHAGQGVLHETIRFSAISDEKFERVCAEMRAVSDENEAAAAPVWRTLTFGDLRAGDVIKSDENGLQGTVIELGGIIAGSDGKERWVRSSIGGSYPRSGDPVLVRHPRPEVGQ